MVTKVAAQSARRMNSRRTWRTWRMLWLNWDGPKRECPKRVGVQRMMVAREVDTGFGLVGFDIH